MPIFGETLARKLARYQAAPVATVAAIKAIGAADRHDGMTMLLTLAGSTSMWRFHSSSALTGDDTLIITPTAGSGRWLRVPGACRLQFAIAFGTADAAVLYTVPTGAYIQPLAFWWQVSTSFTGGTNAAIGVSSNKTGYTTKGDLLGGATGDVLATLAAAGSGATPIAGTVGAVFDTLAKRDGAILVPTNTVRFDRLASAFTAGVGTVNMACNILQNNGA